MRISDWSSDVCSSDLLGHTRFEPLFLGVVLEHPFTPAPAHIVLVTDGFAHFGRAVRLQPGAHLGTKRYQIAHQMLLFRARKLRGLARFTQASTWRRRPAVTARSEEHTSELQSLMRSSYAVFCLKKRKLTTNHYT